MAPAIVGNSLELAWLFSRFLRSPSPQPRRSPFSLVEGKYSQLILFAAYFSASFCAIDVRSQQTPRRGRSQHLRCVLIPRFSDLPAALSSSTPLFQPFLALASSLLIPSTFGSQQPRFPISQHSSSAVARHCSPVRKIQAKRTRSLHRP